MQYFYMARPFSLIISKQVICPNFFERKGLILTAKSFPSKSVDQIFNKQRGWLFAFFGKQVKDLLRLTPLKSLMFIRDF